MKFNKSWFIILCSVLFLLPLSSYAYYPNQSDPLKIMPLGASNTDGYLTPGGYRIKLRELLTQDGYSVDYIGSQSNGPDSLPDKSHEGHSGYRIDQIQANINTWLQNDQPGIVLLMIGHNDMIQNYKLDTAPARLSTLIDTITSIRPNTHVFVASLTPMDNVEYNNRALTYNSAIPGIVENKRSAGKKVTFVNMYDAIGVGDLADFVHPTLEGFNKMADIWFSSIQSMADADPGPSPTPNPTPTPPLDNAGQFIKGINFNGGAISIDGNPWLAESNANVTVSAIKRFANGDVTFAPQTDNLTNSMLNTSIYNSISFNVNQTLANGSYEIYLWSEENYKANFRSFHIQLEGAQVTGSPIGTMPLNEWRKYGPYPVTVQDGVLNMNVVKVTGDPQLVGMVIYKKE